MEHMTSPRPILTRSLAVLVAAAAVACGGGTATAPATPGAPSATVAAATGGAGTPVTSPSATLQPSVPASQAPVPTAIPVVTPSVEPAITPPPSAAAVGPTACDHPYWPLRLGATWTMGRGDAKSVITVISLEGDALSATAEIQSVGKTGSKVTNEILCNVAEGMAYGDSLYENTDGHTGVKNTTAVTGPQIPPVAALVEGAEFTNGSTSDLDFPSYDANGTYTGQLQYQIVLDQTCTVHGPRQITVKAGTFNGFEIDCIGTSVRKAAGEADRNFDYNTNAYWLEGVGFSAIDADAQLVSYSIPPE
jgi:hypothetical protein